MTTITPIRKIKTSILKPDIKNKQEIGEKQDTNLENLRSFTQCNNDLQEIVDDTLTKIQNIHAAYLFHGIGYNVLQILCKYLSGTTNAIYASGWKSFAMELGVDRQTADVIDYSLKDQDPTFYVIFYYIQKHDATLDKILTTLQKIKRYDVINETYKLFQEMGKKINESYEGNTEKKLLRPYKIPEPPFVLKNIQNATELPNKPKNKYDKVVMLTYAIENVFIAQMVANELRKGYDNKKIGVVILQEHEKTVNSDPEIFISNFFSQSHYILPILSVDYLNLISSNSPIVNSAVENLDNTYARYIHKLMVNNYIRNGCCNDKIRGIIPDHLIDLVQRHPSMNNSEFRTWVNLIHIETLAQKILSSNF